MPKPIVKAAAAAGAALGECSKFGILPRYVSANHRANGATEWYHWEYESPIMMAFDVDIYWQCRDAFVSCFDASAATPKE